MTKLSGSVHTVYALKIVPTEHFMGGLHNIYPL